MSAQGIKLEQTLEVARAKCHQMPTLVDHCGCGLLATLEGAMVAVCDFYCNSEIGGAAYTGTRNIKSAACEVSRWAGGGAIVELRIAIKSQSPTFSLD